MHPYMERRTGRQKVSYAHPLLEPVLRRTLGVPLFQEQLLRIAMVIANFTGGEAEELRRALGSRRSQEKMRTLELRPDRLCLRMAEVPLPTRVHRGDPEQSANGVFTAPPFL